MFFLVFEAKAQNVPPGQDAGAQAERYKKEIQQANEELLKEKPKAPEIEFQEEEEKTSPAGGVNFTLKEIVITGVTVFKPEDLALVYQPYLNQQVTFGVLDEISAKIKAEYKQKGYLTTIVYLPEQEISEGKVKIRVEEGLMGKLKIEGNKWFSTSLIEKYFHSKKNEILNIREVQKDILRLNQNPDLELKTIISVGEEKSTSDITLQAKEKFPFHLGVNSDNQGTRLTGKFRTASSFRFSNLTNNFDTLFINSLFTYRSMGEFVSYILPLDTYGTKFGIDIAYFQMSLGKEFKGEAIKGRTHILDPHISWELFLAEDFQANAKVGIEIKSVKKKIQGDVSSSDQLRTPYFGFSFSKSNFLGGSIDYNPKFSFGTSGFLGASHRNHPTSSRDGTGGSFFKFEQSLSRTQRMPFSSYTLMRFNSQAASHTLSSSEQFQLGGANSVRGYPEGDYLADTGVSINLDWIFPMYLIPKDLKLSGQEVPLRYQIEPLIFFDYGTGRLKKVNAGEKHTKNLMGVGGGLRFRFFNKVYLKLEWAKHIGDEPSGGSGPSSFHMTFQAEL